MLTLNVDVSSLNYLSGHSCASCKFLMCDNAIDVFDNLPKLEMSLPIDVKETLVYIAGYIIHKDVPIEDTLHYFDKLGNFTEEMSRGGLAIPYDSICQIVFFFLYFVS